MTFGARFTVLGLPTGLASLRFLANGGEVGPRTQSPPRARRTLTARPYETADEQAVLDLLDTGGSAGPPHAPTVPAQAPAAADLRVGLDRPHTDVLVDQAGRVAGAVSYGLRRRDGIGLLLWLEGGDEPEVSNTLVGHAIGALDPRRTIYAFADTVPPLPGRENGPARRRVVTRQALLAAGFRQRAPHHPMRRPADWTVVRASGELDIVTAPDLRSYLGQQLQAGRPRIITDLSAVTFMDCAGLNALIHIRKRVRDIDGEMRLVTAHRPVLRILRLTGLDTVFLTYPTLEQARTNES